MTPPLVQGEEILMITYSPLGQGEMPEGQRAELREHGDYCVAWVVFRG